MGDGRWLDQALIDLPSNINNWWENATMPTKEKYALNAAEGELNEKSDKKYSAEQFPLYYGASSKQNIVTDGGVDQGMVKHTGYADLDTTNATLNKQNTVNNATYIPGVTKAMGVSSNVSMGWNLESKPTGSTKAASVSNILQQQKNTNLHSGMVDQWQSEFLTNASRDSGAASTWLTDQTVKINSWEGSDRSKSVLKNDLNQRYDNLFKSDSAPFKSNKGNPSLGQGLSYAEKKEATRLAKESAAMNASYIYGPNTNYQMKPQGKAPQGPMQGTSPGPSQNKGSLMDGYNNLGKLGSLEYMFGSKNKDKPGNVSF